jgi:hypothetical protein
MKNTLVCRWISTKVSFKDELVYLVACVSLYQFFALYQPVAQTLLDKSAISTGLRLKTDRTQNTVNVTCNPMGISNSHPLSVAARKLELYNAVFVFRN